MRRIKLITESAGELIIELTGRNPRTAEAIWRALPFESEAERWGDEVYFRLPVKLRLRGERTLMEVGEVAYWPEGNSLCLFFGPTPASKDDRPVAYSDVKPLGRVVEGLQSLKRIRDGEEVRVEIEKD